MKDSIREYAKLGLVHHLLYPASLNSSEEHAKTLAEFVRRDDIEALDCCLPYGEKERKFLPDIIKSANKDVSYAMHLFPLRKISLASLDSVEQAQTRILVNDQIKMAAAIGANGFVFASGADLPYNRADAKKAFFAFCKWFCKELKPYGINALLEPFDRTVDKKFLFGPIDECMELIDSLHNEGCTNIGIELDMAHLPIMFEDFQSSIERTARHLKRVHLGNCVLKDESNPFYGDKHPPMGIEGGEIDVNELVIILKSLLNINYLDKHNKKPLIIEMQPFPGKSIEFTVEDSKRRLKEAWALV